MNFSYTIYQAERTRTVAEQRAEDRMRGEVAAALTRSWRRVWLARRSRGRAKAQAACVMCALEQPRA
jgi:hypothetical protein